MFEKRFIGVFILFNLFIAALLLAHRMEYTFASVNNQYAIVNKSTFKQLSTERGENFKQDHFLIIYGSDDATENFKITERINESLTVLLESIDKTYELVTFEQFLNFSDFIAYDAIVINEEDLSVIPNSNLVMDYVEEGGSLILAQRPLIGEGLDLWSPYLGIEEIEGYTVEDSMVLTSNILIQGEGYTFSETVSTHALDIVLKDECEILVESVNEVPMIWKHDQGEGTVLVANGQFLAERMNRGLLTGILSEIKDDFIYPIVNAKVLHMDDYPMPVPEGTADIIYNEYQVNNEEFFYYIWWPNVLKTTQKYNMKINGYLIYNYENDVSDQDLLLNDIVRRDHLLLQGENLLKSGGELALHGFNHQPLRIHDYLPEEAAVLGYKTWDSIEAMVSSLSNLANYISEVYPNYTPQSYVAPSNILSEEGRVALKEAFPSLRSICALYDDGGVESSYQQEFGRGEDGIYDFPRYSSGYMLTEEAHWNILNGLTFNGVFSHFIHPDDVLDKDRNYGGMSWGKLNEEFDKFMNYLSNDFGWLNNTSISEATNQLEEYVDSQIFFEYKENEISGYIENGKSINYYMMKTDKEITSSENCDYQLIDEGVYLISTNSNEFTLKLGE
ncbi:DUF2194 domain-containing protein [Turicibacter sanguinis]|uniref:DUF2194 domain-containing protein n=1 Tax=Turicibacter sanguinis TaxID=154288 RepID=UPI0006C335C1|nr:DUF2194 domain-containing protein [Turicibacter sanguinis]MDB8564097.1 DUF2194 domain-containing protein [Turicibacter sanguinis]MDB8575913.1 DUF2194 domain-containing protein [Turicibacter sanguinis]MDB8578565.1 DUF2194 domain-containing protein [Turicibacter sanguinis]MDB8584500.1 DUF2194 domain-containing protein [Turicibacter sanguinis]MDB8587453.1 DUF2194 domain-containing protein [Turicibacter sanguinis]